MNKVQGGDEVSLKIQGDGSLLVHPHFETNEKQNQIVLPISDNEDAKMIQRKIIGCYLNGYDQIELTSKTNLTREQQDGIRSIVRSLYMRIYESHANQVTLQAFMDESLASVTSGLERMHIITNSMAKDVIKIIKDWDIGLAKSVISLEEDVDQFMFFLTRLLRTAVNNPSLASKLKISMSDCFDYHLLVNRIEYVADHLTTIAESFIKLHPYRDLVSDSFIEILIQAATEAFENYEQSVDVFFETSLLDTGILIEAADQTKLFDDAIQGLPNTNDDEKKVLLLCQSILENIKIIRNNTADIAEITIDRYYIPQ